MSIHKITDYFGFHIDTKLYSYTNEEQTPINQDILSYNIRTKYINNKIYTG